MKRLFILFSSFIVAATVIGIPNFASAQMQMQPLPPLPANSQNTDAESDYYKSLLERILIRDAETWSETKYVPNSIKNFKIDSRSTNGQPLVIICVFQSMFKHPGNWSGTGLGDNYVEVFFSNGLPYDMTYEIFNAMDRTFKQPPADRPYSEWEIARIKVLQDSLAISLKEGVAKTNKKHYSDIVKLINETYPQQGDIMSFFIKAEYTVSETDYRNETVTSYQSVQTSATEQSVVPVSSQVQKPYSVDVKKIGLKNTASKTLYIKGIFKYLSYGLNTYIDVTIAVKPGEVVPAFKLEPFYNDDSADIGSKIYFKKIGAPLKTDTRLTKDGSPSKENNDALALSEKRIIPFLDKASPEVKALFKKEEEAYKAKNYVFGLACLMKVPNYAPAQHIIAAYYYNGWGDVVQNNETGNKWELKAALQGYGKAERSIGYSYMFGFGVNVDYKIALNWLTKASLQGESEANNDIGTIYNNGYGVEIDQQKAVNYYKMASEKNNENAQYNLALAYYYGNGVEKNETQYLKWMKSSAQIGLKEAKDWCTKNNITYQNQTTETKVIPNNSTTAPAQTPVASQPPTDNFDVKKLLPKTYTGYMNSLASNKSSSCTINLSLNSDSSYHLHSSVDNIHLFGISDCTGYQVVKDGKKMYQFTGKLSLDFPGSPFPKGTTLPITFLVEITEQGLNGTYDIPQTQISNTGHGYGTVDLH